LPLTGTSVFPLPFEIGSIGFAFQALCLYAMILACYLVVNSLAWWLLCNQCIKLDRDALHDIRLSAVSAGIFAVAMATTIQLYWHGLTRIYGQPSTHGWWYIGASYLIVLILQDGYFYVAHRLFHWPRLYRLTHQGHHRSRQPTPWTSFAFDPIEAMTHAIFLVGITCLIPLHLGTIFAILTTMTIWAVVNHIGLDHAPLRFLHQRLGPWMIGPAHHSVHHERQDKHFGLYFTFWDRVMGS